MDGRPPQQAASASAWYPSSSSSQFHYQTQPPPWGTHRPRPPYPAAPPPPYPHYPSPHYPPPPLPPRPPQAYPPPPPSNQARDGHGWGHHQESNAYLSNEEDLAARARAWAAARAAMDHQQSLHSSHFGPPVGEAQEEHQNYLYQEQFHQQHNQLLRPNYFHGAPSHMNQLPQSNTFSTGPSSQYVSNGQVPSYTGGNIGGFGGSVDSSTSVSPPVHSVVPPIYQQEVPSSYSSHPGAEGALREYEQMPTSTEVGSEVHPQPHVAMSSTDSIMTEHPPSFTSGDVTAVSFPDAKAVNVSLYQVHYARPEQGVEDHLVPWASSAASHGVVISSISLHLPADYHTILTVEPTFSSPSSLAAPAFGRIPAPSGFHTSIPGAATVSASPFAVTAASNVIHPAALISGDANVGFVNASERPKKSAVPNWLREEIIKKKTIIASSVQDHKYEQRPSPSTFEGEDADNSLKDDFPDNKSSGSSGRSVENNDDNEEDADVARTAAMNQQIKRILTEVLLKVTDELLDEIATKVMNEDDDQGVEDATDEKEADHVEFLSHPALPTTTASTKVLVLVQGKRSVNGHGVDGKDFIASSGSRSGGDVLGLGNYASDEDEDEVQSSPNKFLHEKQRKDNACNEVESRLPDTEFERVNNGNLGEHYINREEDCTAIMNNGITNNHVGTSGGIGDVFQKTKAHMPSAEAGGERKVHDKLELLNKRGVNENRRSINEGTGGSKREERNKQGDVKEGKYVSKVVSDTKREEREKRDMKKEKVVSSKEARDSSKEDRDEKTMRSKEGREVRSDVPKEERADRSLSSKDERIKDGGSKHVETVREANLGQTAHRGNLRDGRKRQEGVKRSESNREDVNYRRKELREDEKEDISMRHQGTSDMGRKHKRSRSPTATRGRRRSRDGLGSGESDLSGEVPAKSRERKMHYNGRSSLSPSPSRSRRRRRDSRSPHSKQSQRRQSPFSSHDSRRQRSRSRTPERRRR